MKGRIIRQVIRATQWVMYVRYGVFSVIFHFLFAFNE